MNTNPAEQQDLKKIKLGHSHVLLQPDDLFHGTHPLSPMQSLSSRQGASAREYFFQVPERWNTGGYPQVFTSAEEVGSGIIYSDILEVFTMSANRYSCMKLVQELPDAALPETIETLTDLRDHYRSLENPSVRRPTPSLEYNVKPHVSSTE